MTGSQPPLNDDSGPDGPDLLPGAVDARFTLASERTMLAWLRLALGLIAAGVAVLHLLEPWGDPTARRTLGIALLTIGAFTAIVGMLRWHEIDRALKRGGPLPGPWPIWTLTGLIVIAAIGFALWS
ncbi:hypothetical protein GOHSU_26_00140 [Gordonia hirsuta DSM 44140 = NBRC 16056]|uniref:DUF202 domain-containing protein n=1 Tax=Gordonia hirsuta DSM 44140 = NBRC 16056 TaxID=1121927 RepID=L7LCQ0_9ACTN|nr:DUF202 domain-containing protein [Gordonia hirsuta]GAC57857.1 hypothetical protein GOHSU_26_00140 [Gordonia hirsuta DSM 44140 = NBRC 16056]